MNELLRQFVIESRELAQAASDGLLALEQSPGEGARLDEVFRAFHTLKGSAAIVHFPAMERAMHAAEDTLAGARAGRRPLPPARIGECLARLDQVTGWLDAIERSGELPRDTASHPDRLGPDEAGRLPRRAAAAWLQEMLDSHPQAAARALAAIRFVPAADSLYRGEDPVDRMTSLPGLLALELTAREPWGALDTLDPFRCNLVLTALSSDPAADLERHLQGHTGDCEIVPVEDSGRPLPAPVLELIGAQQALLGEEPARGFAGRVGSAGSVAANALRFCGRIGLSRRIAAAAERSLLERSAQPLRQALERVLARETPSGSSAAGDLTPAPDVAARTVRIDAGQVDALVRLAGELAVISNAIGHVAKLAQTSDPSLPDLLKDRHAALARLVGELQTSVLRMRVRPLRVVLQRFPRLVRETSADLGKAVRLVIEGDETEADKTIVEMLPEPLLHVVRNAIDHGVESATERAAAGKAATATLRIKASRQADQVLIEVSDDGAGVDLSRVGKVALARGLITEEQLRALTAAEALELIFAPGFSTAAKVTGISGRGVGMDAVRRAVERVGGHVSIASVAGQGTEVKLSLPFSVMMTRVMTVEAGGQMFGLPLDAIIETVRVPPAAVSQVGAAPAVVLRDRPMPLIDLAGVLGLEPQVDDQGATLVVAAANGECGAFRVDRIVERLDLILRPLEGLLAGTPGIMGTTLLGDGRVLLVLDIAEMLQ
ncbi:MAG TPA: chemotaxis protein CheA [Steroidobacteraceae bacterium]|nr:chemotaxis protein CheA [Steroidobacteraceae bacterium]